MESKEEFFGNDHGNILIVDDDAQIRLLVAKFLQRHGYHVYALADGNSITETLE